MAPREPKVTLTTPAEALAAAKADVTVTDAAGRKIVLRKPGVLSQFRLVRVLGAQASENTVYMNMVAPIIYVASIDGDVIPQPTSEAEVEALIQRLDEDGLVAVMQGVQQHFAGQDPEAAKRAVKE